MVAENRKDLKIREIRCNDAIGNKKRQVVNVNNRMAQQENIRGGGY